MKNILFMILVFVGLSQKVFAQDNYQLSSHILDINKGEPAKNVKITLSKKQLNNSWIIIDEKNTDENGRIRDFLKYNENTNSGIYKLTYHIESYFRSIDIKSFYPFIEVVFEISDNKHYHVPITLSPFGYSTYRGN